MKSILDSLIGGYDNIKKRVVKLETIISTLEDNLEKNNYSDLSSSDIVLLYEIATKYHLEVLKTVQEITKMNVVLNDKELMMLYLFKKISDENQDQLINRIKDYFE